MKMMGWTAPALRHRSAITWSSLNATMRGAVRYASYHNRFGYRQESLSDPRRRSCRRGCYSEEAEAVRAVAILRSPCAMPGRHRGLCDRALLGTRIGRVRPSGPAGAAELRQGLPEARQERRGRCGGDLR